MNTNTTQTTVEYKPIKKTITLNKFCEIPVEHIIHQFPHLRPLYAIYLNILTEQEQNIESDRDTINKINIRMSNFKHALWFLAKESIVQEW